MYVIKNIETGKYVARFGSERSYTTKLSEMRVYKTHADATADLCRGNEIVEAIDRNEG
jgi:hypothetical protein